MCVFCERLAGIFSRKRNAVALTCHFVNIVCVRVAEKQFAHGRWPSVTVDIYQPTAVADFVNFVV